MIEPFRWEQPEGTTTQLAMPLRGGLILLDQKRAADETQWVQFDIVFGDVLQNPQDHFFVLIDSWFDYLPNPVVPYAGRGPIFYNNEISLERFETQEVSETHKFTIDPTKTYTVIVHASQEWVAVWLRDGLTDLVYFSGKLPDVLTGVENISMICLGSVATQGMATISNIKQGRFS